MSLLHRTFSADGVSVSLDRAKRLPVSRPSLNFQMSPTPSSHNSTTLLQSSPSSSTSAMPTIDGSHPIMYHRQHANSLDLSALAQASREMGFHSAIASSSSSSSRHYHPIVSSHRPQHSPSYSPPSTGGGMHRSPSSGSIGIGLSRYDHRSSPVDIPRPRVSIKRPSRSPDIPATPINDPSIPHSQLIPMASNVTTSSSSSSASPRPLPTSAPIQPVVFPDEFEVLGPAGDSTCETYIVRSKITGATSVFKPAAGEAYREKGKPLPASVSGARVRLLPPNSDALSTSPPSANSDDALSPLQSPMGSPPLTVPNEASSLFVQDTRTPLKHGVVYGDTTVKEAAAFLLDHEHFAGVPPTTVATLLLKRSRSRQHLLTASDQENVDHRDRDETKTDDNKIDREIVVPVYGSLQQFAENEGSAEDMGTGMFSVDEVHKIGVLDIRLLNLDRHLANILVSRDSDNQYHLVPIDHGYILPSYRDLRDVRLEWQWWKQCSVPFSDKTQNYIARLNPLQDAITLRALGLREESIISMVFASILLKRAAAEGLTLDVIASMVQRKPSYRDDEDADRGEAQADDEEDDSEPSCLENIITKVLSMVATQGLSRPALPEPERHSFMAPHPDDDFPRITLMGSPSMRAVSEPSDPDLSPSPFSRRSSSSSSSSNGAPPPSLDGARVLVANALSIPPKFDLDAPLDGPLEEFTERATPASSPSLHRQTSSVSTGSNPSLSRTSSSIEDHDDALIQVARAFLSGSPASGPVDIVRSMNGCTIEEHTGSPPSTSSHMPSTSSSPTNDAVPAAGGANSVPFESTSHLDHLNGEMPSFPARSSSEPASSSSTGDLLVHDRVRLERLLELTVNVMDEEIDKAKRIQAEESIARQEREARWGPPRKLSSNSSNQLVAVNSELAALSRVRSSPTSFARQLIIGIQHAISVDL